MSKLVSEQHSVKRDGGHVVIDYEGKYESGVTFPGHVEVAVGNVAWLAQQLEAAAADAIGEEKTAANGDDITVYVRGGDRGAPININLHLARPGAKTQVISAMSAQTAKQIAAELRAAAA